VLQSLAAASYRLAVVSNAAGTIAQQLERARRLLAGQGMPQVTTIIDSHVVGIRKPDAWIFQLALDALDVTADHSVYAGDSVRFDVLGAQAVGLHRLHVDLYGSAPAITLK